jgi:hypothetical protein
MKASMRKSSGYDSWETYRQSRHYSWANGFMDKHVGELIDDVYSVFRQSLSKRHVTEKVFEEMTEWFKTECGLKSAHNWWRKYNVDEDGILHKTPKKVKSKDKVVNYGEPVAYYRFNTYYEARMFPYIAVCFGYRRACEMIKEGITQKEYLYDTNEVKRLNNLFEKENVKSTPYSSVPMDWRELWWRYYEYPYTEILKYRSREYYRYWYEHKDAERKHRREYAEYQIQRFNLCELQHSEKPFFI